MLQCINVSVLVFAVLDVSVLDVAVLYVVVLLCCSALILQCFNVFFREKWRNEGEIYKSIM